MKIRVEGVIVPPVTPFNAHGQIDVEAIRDLSDFLITSGVNGLFPGGTTSEGPLLTTSERFQLAETFVDAVDGRVPVIVHTGAITTAETLELTRHAQTIGARAAAVIAPYYYRYDDEALITHFSTIARQTPDFPIYIYNFPTTTGNNLSREVIVHLIDQCPNITGMKDSTNNLDTLFFLSSTQNVAFNSASGGDGLILSALALGIDACVSGNANVVPELVVALYQAVLEGDLKRARVLQSKVNAVRHILKDGADLSLFKGILGRRGLAVGTVRPPLMQASEEMIEDCWQELTALNLDLKAM